ncbi:MAG: radical SAM protein [Thermodesulfobacteria bacterium]|nr:radical SAM protein [Thermodesulfobacteriota bacterium]
MTNKKSSNYPSLVYANSSGEIFDYPGLDMAGRRGRSFFQPDVEDLIPLPEGSELFIIPESSPIAWDPFQEDFVVFDTELPDGQALAVAAFMAPAYTQTALAAYRRESQEPLPLFAYTAVGWWKGRFWVPAFRSDRDKRQDIKGFRQEEVIRKTRATLKKFRKNRLIQHLGKCSLTYGCPAAKNFFLGRYEAPLPSSPVCNARCLGCLSYQPEGGPPSTQERITFTPSAKELSETALLHLKRVKNGVVSFGQGCEGEPLMQAELLEATVALIRKEHRDGTVNLNTNASRPKAIEALARKGLDSIRISMNSVDPRFYDAYYRPKGYRYQDVLESWQVAKAEGLHVSLNLFVMPGLTDLPSHFDRLCGLIDRYGLDLIQLRNHNIDPDWYMDSIGFDNNQEPLGIRTMVKELKKRFPLLKFGYFNPPVKKDKR